MTSQEDRVNDICDPSWRVCYMYWLDSIKLYNICFESSFSFISYPPTNVITAKKKVVSELTTPFISILKLADTLIKGRPTWENIIDNLTMQTVP